MHTAIRKEFDTNSSDYLSDNESNEVIKRIHHAKNIKSVLVSWNKSQFLTDKDFLESFGTLIQQLCFSSASDSYDLALIYQEYLKIVSPYIFDFFNREILGDTDISIKKIQTMVYAHLLDIVNLYLDGLQKS